MAKKVYNNTPSLKTKASKPKAVKEIKINTKKQTEKKPAPKEGLDSYAYGLDCNIYLL